MILDYEEYNNSENKRCFQIDCVLNDRKYVIVGYAEHNKKLIAKCNYLYDTVDRVKEDDYATIYMLISSFTPMSEHYTFQLMSLKTALMEAYFWEVVDE